MDVFQSHTYNEMLDSIKVGEEFDFNQTKNIAEKIGGKRIIFSGLGSSLLYPGKHAKNRALKLGLENTIEVYFASDLLQYTNFKDTFVFLASNSGKTKETMLLLDHAKKHGATVIAITAVADSPLAARCEDVIVLKGGFEKGVAATKSVFEQGLIYDSLIFHLAVKQGKLDTLPDLSAHLKKTVVAMKENITREIPQALVEKIVHVNQYMFAGLDNGLGEELALKTNEMVRKPGTFFPDTQILHGPAEVIQNSCLFILEPNNFLPFTDDFKKFGTTTSSVLVSIENSSLFEYAVPYSSDDIFVNYCLLSAGWGILMHLAKALDIDIDNPTKISKVGNPYIAN